MTRAFSFASAFLVAIAAVTVTLGAACGGGQKEAPAPVVAEPVAAEPTVVSTDILAREPVSNHSEVKHILVSWSDKAESFAGGMDPRAQGRSRADAEALVRDVVAQLQGGADFDTLMREHSEDTGSAASGRPFTVTPDAGLVIEFRQLGLRLNVGEIGVVESDFGFHVIKRVE